MARTSRLWTIPFRKRQKYGVKTHELCFPDEYTNNLKIYAGKNGFSVSQGDSYNVAMRLASQLLQD